MLSLQMGKKRKKKEKKKKKKKKKKERKKEITGTVTVTVDYIRRNGINHWQFLRFLKEVGSECNDFICYSVAR
jgi:hypothetical protein